MSRGVGEFDVIQGLVPESLAVVVALLTQLGDSWFVTLLFVVAFVRFDRDRVATGGGLVMGAIALVFITKYLFALPRPDQPLIALGALPPLLQPVYVATGYASGYGFPSGHAVVSTAAYLSLAEALPVSTRQRRYAAAAGIIAVVCLCRIALGLHYLVDVVAGVGLSVAFLLLARGLLARYRSPDDRRTVALGVGVALALVSVVATGAHIEALLLFVIASAIFVLFWYLDRPRAITA